jgi:CBS domain-containing protein
MQARDVMVRGVIAVGPDMTVRAAANSMVTNRISAIPVVDINAKLVGIVSEGDLMHRVENQTQRRRSWWLEMFVSTDQLAQEFVKSHAKCVRDVMTRHVITVSPQTSLRDIAALLEKHAIKRVPVIEDGKVVGIVSRANLLQAMASVGDDDDTGETDRNLRWRILESIKDKPWASRPFNVIVKQRSVDLWGFVYSEDEKAAIRVAAEATPGVQAVNDNLKIMSYMPTS